MISGWDSWRFFSLQGPAELDGTTVGDTASPVSRILRRNVRSRVRLKERAFSLKECASDTPSSLGEFASESALIARLAGYDCSPRQGPCV